MSARDVRLARRIRDSDAPQRGTKWQHFKGWIYSVEDVGILDETEQVAIVYRSPGADFPWIRTLENWKKPVGDTGEQRFSEFNERDTAKKAARHLFFLYDNKQPKLCNNSLICGSGLLIKHLGVLPKNTEFDFASIMATTPTEVMVKIWVLRDFKLEKVLYDGFVRLSDIVPQTIPPKTGTKQENAESLKTE